MIKGKATYWDSWSSVFALAHRVLRNMTHDRHRNSSLMVAVSSSRWRRVAFWIFVATIFLMTQSYYYEIRNSGFVRSTLDIFGKLKEDRRSKFILHILLVAYARTGSSFIGDVIQSVPDSFYFFEPLHFIQGNVLNDSFDEARDLLGNLFTCNVSQVENFLSWQKQHKNYMKLHRNTRYWKECSKLNSCYNASYIDAFCRNQTTVISKTIRLDLNEASKLFTSHPHLNLKIIYLVRDPRGTMNSRMKKPVSAWCKKDIMCSNSAHFCSDLANDVSATCNLLAERPNDFMVIRYEDMSTDPFGVTEQLIKFLGLYSVPKEVYMFLKTHTYFAGNVKKKSKAAGLEYSYTTFRNSSITAMSWRKEMNFRSVTRLQNQCSRFLSAFGYYSYRTTAVLRSNNAVNTDLQQALQNTCDT